MRIIPALLLFLSVINLSFAEDINQNDAAIYQSALKTILNHEQPQHFAVWSETVNAATILTPRVPRHAPENQFVEALHGLPPVLQKQLLTEQRVPLLKFDPALRFLDQAALLTAAPDLVAVGFSKIVYDRQHNALLYAEVCLGKNEAVCGGEGYWFVQSGAAWKLNKHAYLFGGSTTPFWNLGHAN